MQVGYVGLVAAINNFDPAAGCSLATYAHPHITGEIKRYFRDKRWQVHVARPVKDLAMQARAATWQLTQELGRMPAESDLAASLGVSGQDLRNARLAEMAFQPSSLDVPLSGQPGAAMARRGNRSVRSVCGHRPVYVEGQSAVGTSAWLSSASRGSAHHLAQRCHRCAPSTGPGGPPCARVHGSDLRWHGRDGAVRG
jgi:Sigma-70 region 2/Sigma-70 region 3